MLGRRAAQRGDPNPHPEVRVEEVAEVTDAGGAIEPPPADVAAGGADAYVPGLAAGDEPDELQDDGQPEDPDRRLAERGDEVVALTPEPDDERGGDHDASDHRRRGRVSPRPGANCCETAGAGTRGCGRVRGRWAHPRGVAVRHVLDNAGQRGQQAGELLRVLDREQVPGPGREVKLAPGQQP